jgi:hypothetical protein
MESIRVFPEARTETDHEADYILLICGESEVRKSLS